MSNSVQVDGGLKEEEKYVCAKLLVELQRESCAVYRFVVHHTTGCSIPKSLVVVPFRFQFGRKSTI